MTTGSVRVIIKEFLEGVGVVMLAPCKNDEMGDRFTKLKKVRENQHSYYLKRSKPGGCFGEE